MSVEDPRDLKRIDREIRINELRHEAEELAGGNMHAWESDGCPPEIAEAFWQRVVDFEKAPWTSHFQQLVEAGVELPDPEAMTDARLTAKLWEVINRLAEIRVFLCSTNHLSDRELYTALWTEVLHERTADVVMDEYSSCHIDLIGSGSEEDIYLQMKYYADEEERRDWLAQFPNDAMPDREDPPYDRDRHLPKSKD